MRAHFCSPVSGGVADGLRPMYNSYIVKRTQIYLDERQDERLGRLARSAGVTKSNLIREAIDAFLAGSNDGRDRLARFHSLLDAVERSPISLPDGASYVEELRRADSLRLDELDRREEE